MIFSMNSEVTKFSFIGLEIILFSKLEHFKSIA